MSAKITTKYSKDEINFDEMEAVWDEMLEAKDSGWIEAHNVQDCQKKVKTNAAAFWQSTAINLAKKMMKIAEAVAQMKDNRYITLEDMQQAKKILEDGIDHYLPKAEEDWNM